MPPSLVLLSSVAEYREYYERHYCRSQTFAFDGLRVFFPKQQFDDAFFESASRKARDKSVFSWHRAQRIAWIASALQDSSAELYAGWDRERKRLDPKRRVSLVYGNYVVVLQLHGKRQSATFITAYVADAPTIEKIRSGPKWEHEMMNHDPEPTNK